MAGSKPGERRGGRQKGTLNRKTAEQKAFLQSIIGTPEGDPFLIVMGAIKSPETPPDIKLRLCIEMMPYVRPKLASIEQRDGGRSHEDRLAELQRMLAEDDTPQPVVIEGEAVAALPGPESGFDDVKER